MSTGDWHTETWVSLASSGGVSQRLARTVAEGPLRTAKEGKKMSPSENTPLELYPECAARQSILQSV